jgi:hypothetical protein
MPRRLAISISLAIVTLLTATRLEASPAAQPATPTPTPRPAPSEDRVGFPDDYQTAFQTFFISGSTRQQAGPRHLRQ